MISYLQQENHKQIYQNSKSISESCINKKQSDK